MKLLYKLFISLCLSLFSLHVNAGTIRVTKLLRADGQEVTLCACDHALDDGEEQLRIIEEAFTKRMSPLTLLSESAKLYGESLDSLWVCKQRLRSPTFFTYDEGGERVSKPAYEGHREYIFQALPLTLARHILRFSTGHQLMSIDPRGVLFFRDWVDGVPRGRIAKTVTDHFLDFKGCIDLELIENMTIKHQLDNWLTKLILALLELQQQLLLPGTEAQEALRSILDSPGIFHTPEVAILYAIARSDAPSSIAVFAGASHTENVLNALFESGEYEIIFDTYEQTGTISPDPQSPYGEVCTLADSEVINYAITACLADPVADAGEEHFVSLDPVTHADLAFFRGTVEEAIEHCLVAMGDPSTRQKALELLCNEGVLGGGNTKAALIVAKAHDEDGNYEQAVTCYEYAYDLGAHREAIDGLRSMGGCYIPSAYVLARMIMGMPQKRA